MPEASLQDDMVPAVIAERELPQAGVVPAFFSTDGRRETNVDALMVLAIVVQLGYGCKNSFLRLSTLAECALTVAQQAIGEALHTEEVEEQEVEIIEPTRPRHPSFSREEI
eukprot:11924916-Alexandrium_andersonii.AAC.1